MALEKLKRTNLIQEIGVVRGSGFDTGIQALEKTKRTADTIIDNAFRYGADKVSKEGLYDAKDKQVDYKTEYYVEGPNGARKITDLVDKNENIIGSFKTPIIDERLKSGRIYNNAYNQERDKIYGLSIKAQAQNFAAEMYVKFNNDSESYVQAVDSYLEKVKENVGPTYRNDVELLEANVFNTYYKQISMRELQEQMSADATALLMGFDTTTNNTTMALKDILPNLNSGDISLSWDADKNEIQLNIYNEEKDSSLYAPVQSLLESLNKDINENIIGSNLISSTAQINAINGAKRSFATAIISQMTKDANISDEPIENQINLRQLQLAIKGEEENVIINDLKEFVGNDQTVINAWSEMVNGRREIIDQMNLLDKTNIKLFMETELMEDMNELYSYLVEGKHNPRYLSKLAELNKKWSSMDILFKDWGLEGEDLEHYNKYLETKEGKHLLQSIIGSQKNQTIMNNNTYLKLMKEQSSVWTAGKIIEFLEIADDLDALENWYNELVNSDEFAGYDLRYQKQIIQKVITAVKAIDADLGKQLAKMNKVTAVLSVNVKDGIGYAKLDPHSAEDRKQAEAYINYKDLDKLKYTHPIYGVDESSLKIRGSDENQMLKFIANSGVLPTTEYDWLNAINTNTFGNDKSRAEALSKFHFFKKVANLTDYSGENMGQKIIASLEPETISTFRMIERQLNYYNPTDNLEVVMSAIRDRIDDDQNLTKSNNFNAVEYYGTDEKIKSMFDESEIWDNMRGYDKFPIEKVWASEAKYNILEVYKTNRFKGFDAQAAMDSAITHTLFFKWGPSKYGFSSLSADVGWKEGKPQMAHLPVEAFFSGYDTNNDGKSDMLWLDDFLFDNFVVNADWEFINGIKVEDVAEKTEVATWQGAAGKKVTPAHTTYQILKYPDNPKAGYIDLKWGENLFLKAKPNDYNKGYPMYEIFFRQPDVGQLYWGQLKKLTDKDGEAFLVDVGEHYEKINKERFHLNIKQAKDMRLEWKKKQEVTFDDEGRMYIGGKLFVL